MLQVAAGVPGDGIPLQLPCKLALMADSRRTARHQAARCGAACSIHFADPLHGGMHTELLPASSRC